MASDAPRVGSDAVDGLWAGLDRAFGGPIVELASVVALVLTVADRSTLSRPSVRALVEELIASLEQAGGLTNAFSDCTTGVFLQGSTPTTVNDAMSAALEIRDAMRREVELQAVLRASIGVATGPVMLERDRPDESGLSIAGAALAEARQLASPFEPLTVAASQMAYQQARTRFEATATRAGGTDAGRTVYTITGRKRRRSWRSLLAEHDEPIRGRDDELLSLRDALAATVAGSGGVVHLVGEPGSGKSKLLETFVRTSLGEAPGLFALRSWGSCYGGAPFELVTDLENEIGAGELALRAERERSSANLATRIAAVSRLALVCVVIDDLHWFDADSQTWLAGALGSWRAAPMLVVLSYRPSLDARGIGLRAAPDRVLELGPLDDAAARRLVGRVAPGLDGPTGDCVVRRAAGNPLYIEEACAMLQSGGPIASLPSGLEQLLLDRVRRWSADAVARLGALRRDGSASQRLTRELEDVEQTIDDWLDRIEAVGFVRRVDVVPALRDVRAVDTELRVLCLEAGIGASHRGRLREAYERLTTAPVRDWGATLAGIAREEGSTAAGELAIELIEIARGRADWNQVVALTTTVLNTTLDNGTLLGTADQLRAWEMLAEALETIGDDPTVDAYVKVAQLDSRRRGELLARGALAATRLGLVDRAESLIARAQRPSGPATPPEVELVAALVAVARGAADARDRIARAVRTCHVQGKDDLVPDAAVAQLALAAAGGHEEWHAALLELVRCTVDIDAAAQARLALALASNPLPSSDGPALRQSLRRRYALAAASIARDAGLSGWHVRAQRRGA